MLDRFISIAETSLTTLPITFCQVILSQDHFFVYEPHKKTISSGTLIFQVCSDFEIGPVCYEVYIHKLH